MWQFSVNGDDNSVHFRLESHSGEENYPGKVEASVTYQLTDDDEVCINFGAETDEKTLINMTNHAFFNLGGQVGWFEYWVFFFIIIRVIQILLRFHVKVGVLR